MVRKEIMDKDELSSATKVETNQEKETFMAACVVLRSDDARYRRFLDDLKSPANRRGDECPTIITNAFDLLVHEFGECDTSRGNPSMFRPRRPRGGPRGGRGRNDFLFAQRGRGGRGNREERKTFSRTNGKNSDELAEGIDGEMHPHVTCYGCYFLGHYRDQCPCTTREDVQAMHEGCTLTQDVVFTTPKSCILLDMCST